ncbi:peptidylprolyl isomerase [Sphingomonas soli]|uniref:peptidylprolyl isomerase n=1 Tax=Sphingomonas soli TaxID=266127 RepID=UPI00082EB147|nr:peptidylprolyl isomerase [Sphingomonas soli]
MLRSFRNFTKSRFGLIAVFVFLAIIALAFAAGDITGLQTNTGASNASLAQVGRSSVTESEVRDRIDRFLRNAQREGQNVTMERFLAEGGMEMVLDEIINSAAIVEFANKSGMQVSKRLIDGEIASNPSFIGFDGKFSQKTYEDILAQNRLSPAIFRDGMTKDKYGTWLINRAALGNPTMPDGVLLPYASLLLERRKGIVGLVSTIAMDPGADPDEKTLTAFYAANRNRYLVPEQRVIRYAILRPETLKEQSTATEAEIAEEYKKDAAKYAATEKRSVDVVTTLDQATATSIANAAKSGALDAAARAAGLEARKFVAADKATLTSNMSAAFAEAAFAAQQGQLSGPAKVGAAWLVFRVNKVEKIAARSLDQVRAEIASEVTSRKMAQSFADLRQAIEDGVGAGKTFDESVKDAKLSAERTGQLTAQGIDPANPESKPDPALAPIVRAGFAFQAVGDEPQLVPISQDGAAALISLEKIVPAAPKPLAAIRDQVNKDYLVDQALKKARAAATSVIAKLEKGVPMEKALAEAGVQKGPPPKPFDFKRSETQGKENFIQMAFSMAPKKAKLVEAPNRAGYYVVYLDSVEEHSAAGDPATMAQAKAGIVPQVAPEYARQFIRAIRESVKIKRNEAAIKKLRDDLNRTSAR